MIYRTSHRATYRNINQNLGSLSYRIAQLTNQIASEKRINTPSDDPSGAATVLGIRSSMASIKQYQDNIAVSDLWLNDSGAAVQSIKETLDEIYTKAEQGSTDTYNATQRGIIADEIDQLFQSIVQYADTKIGDTYIFGGQAISTQPFSLQVEAQKVAAGCQNSRKWTGHVQNYGDAVFNNRPDLPIQGQDFLVEVVQPGGVDSRFYAEDTALKATTVAGANYALQFVAQDVSHNNVEIELVKGPRNDAPQTGAGSAVPAANNGLTYASSLGPVTVNYVLGDTAGTTAHWDGADNTLTVRLQTDASGKSVARATDVRGAFLQTPASAVIDCGYINNGTLAYGVVQPGSITFNNGTTAEVNGNKITVYLKQGDSVPPATSAAIVATAQEVIDAVRENPAANALVSVNLAGGDPAATVGATGRSQQLTETLGRHTTTLGGPGYEFRLTSKDPKYDGTRVEFALGPRNDIPTTGAGTGSAATNNGLKFTSTVEPLTVEYVYGSSAATTAVYSAASHTLTVALQTQPTVTTSASSASIVPTPASATCSIATAFDVHSAVSALNLTGISCGYLNSAVSAKGVVQPGSLNFNNRLSARASGDTITVYLEQSQTRPPQDGHGVNTPQEVLQALNQEASARLNIDLVQGDPAARAVVGAARLANITDMNTATVTGPGYEFSLTAKEKLYNDTGIQIVAGPRNDVPETGHGTATSATNNGLRFGGAKEPLTVRYVYGSSAATTAAWDDDSHTLTVALQTQPTVHSAASASVVLTPADPERAIATAQDVFGAVSALAHSASVFAAGDLTCAYLNPSVSAKGLVEVGSLTFNHKTTAEVKGHQITVYLERAEAKTGQTGGLVATAQDVIDAVRGNPQANAMVSMALAGGDPQAQAAPTIGATQLTAGQPYTLARAEADPKGTQNGLVFSVKNNTANIGEAGNKFSVEYVMDVNPAVKEARVDYDEASAKFTVHGAVDEPLYHKIFIQAYNDPASGCYKDALKAHDRALEYAVTTTAADVKNLFEASATLSALVEVALADGNSGEGRINTLARTRFSQGYDQAALFRVSQDGGQTWGPPMDFEASEYKTGDMFYNKNLGHGSLTTALRGQANDLVFTAKYQGTWSNEISVAYNVPKEKGLPMKLDVEPSNPWSINVTLATDSEGRITTTANDIMSAVNHHPIASQLVTADLANYHEGGGGVVAAMDCTLLKTAEPYEVDGKTAITPLGHATRNVSFNYTAPGQKCPNVIFQAIDQGLGGDDIGIRYTTSADPTYFYGESPSADLSAANHSYQDFTSVRYGTEVCNGVEKKVLVVHLATSAKTSCPDAEKYPEAAEGWKKAFPLYACTEDRVVTTTAGAVVAAVIQKNLDSPQSAMVWASLERYPDGAGAKVGPTGDTLWLEGGSETESAANHGVNLRFLPDGSALQTGDVFEVPVGWYRGDGLGIDINASSGFRNQKNVTGDDIFGRTAEEGNIMDTVQRLVFALNNNDSAAVGKELPNLKAALEKVTTLETSIGTRMIRNEFVNKNLDTNSYNAQSLLSTTEDAAWEELITNLKNSQTVYEAVLGATGLTNKLSLLNYI